MTPIVERLRSLWTQPIAARPDARAAFAEVYADPVMVNGVAMTITELAGRARSLQQAFDRLGMDITDIVEAPGRIVIAFIMRGRHAGPCLSPLGTVAPTHRGIEVRTMSSPSPMALYQRSGSSLTTLPCSASWARSR